MFGDVCFADVTFSGLLQIVIINYKNVHGRTKVAAIIDATTGQIIVLEPKKYHGTTRVIVNKNLQTSVNTSDNTSNNIYTPSPSPAPSPTPSPTSVFSVHAPLFFNDTNGLLIDQAINNQIYNITNKKLNINTFEYTMPNIYDSDPNNANYYVLNTEIGILKTWIQNNSLYDVSMSFRATRTRPVLGYGTYTLPGLGTFNYSSLGTFTIDAIPLDLNEQQWWANFVAGKAKIISTSGVSGSNLIIGCWNEPSLLWPASSPFIDPVLGFADTYTRPERHASLTQKLIDSCLGFGITNFKILAPSVHAINNGTPGLGLTYFQRFFQNVSSSYLPYIAPDIHLYYNPSTGISSTGSLSTSMIDYNLNSDLKTMIGFITNYGYTTSNIYVSEFGSFYPTGLGYSGISTTNIVSQYTRISNDHYALQGKKIYNTLMVNGFSSSNLIPWASYNYSSGENGNGYQECQYSFGTSGCLTSWGRFLVNIMNPPQSPLIYGMNMSAPTSSFNDLQNYIRYEATQSFPAFLNNKQGIARLAATTTLTTIQNLVYFCQQTNCKLILNLPPSNLIGTSNPFITNNLQIFNAWLSYSSYIYAWELINEPDNNNNSVGHGLPSTSLYQAVLTQCQQDYAQIKSFSEYANIPVIGPSFAPTNPNTSEELGIATQIANYCDWGNLHWYPTPRIDGIPSSGSQSLGIQRNWTEARKLEFTFSIYKNKSIIITETGFATTDLNNFNDTFIAPDNQLINYLFYGKNLLEMVPNLKAIIWYKDKDLNDSLNFGLRYGIGNSMNLSWKPNVLNLLA